MGEFRIGRKYAQHSYPDPPRRGAAAGAVQVIRFLLGTITASSLTVLPIGAIVLRATLDVTTPYSMGTSITIGQAGFPTAFQVATDNNPTVNGLYQASQDTSAPAAAAVLATVAGAPVAGAAFVIVEYVVTPQP